MKPNLFFVWCFCFFSLSMYAQNPIKPYKIGDKIENFNLKSTKGNIVGLTSSQHIEGYILVFTANQCPFSKMYEDRIAGLQMQFSPQGYSVIAINANNPTQSPEDSFETMVEKAKQKNYAFPYLYDETQTVVNKFGVMRTPQAFVVQKKGANFILVYSGAIDDKPDNEDQVSEKYVKNAVNQLLGGKIVVINTTKPVGCTVK